MATEKPGSNKAFTVICRAIEGLPELFENLKVSNDEARMTFSLSHNGETVTSLDLSERQALIFARIISFGRSEVVRDYNKQVSVRRTAQFLVNRHRQGDDVGELLAATAHELVVTTNDDSVVANLILPHDNVANTLFVRMSNSTGSSGQVSELVDLIKTLIRENPRQFGYRLDKVLTLAAEELGGMNILLGNGRWSGELAQFTERIKITR